MVKHGLPALALVLFVLAGGELALAAELEGERFYAGGGLNRNEIGSEDSTGYQIFLGYELPLESDPLATSVEIGFWDAGDFDRRTPAGRRDFDVEGVWANAVVSVALGPRIKLIGRLGLDFGDDDGPMAGIGLGFDLDEHLQLRGEFVERDETESIQANLLYRF